MDDAMLLGVWETARGQSPVERALTILSAGEPTAARQELAALSLGDRNARLLELYRQSFGPRLHGFARCPSCGASMEVDVDAERLAASSTPATPGTEQVLTSNGYTLRFRLPDSRALASAACACDIDEARRILVGTCVTEVQQDDARRSPDQLPHNVVADLASQMALLDPHADLRLELSCPECPHQWELALDPADYLWTELSARARRLLREVDALARAYGWSEPEILALSAARREAYLELVL